MRRAHCSALSAATASIWAAPGLPGFLGAGLALLMAAIAVIDARHFIIPNELNAAALALALINAAALAPGALAESLAEALLRGAATFLLFFALRVAYRRLRGREGMGLGDVKLAFVAGVWLGWTLIPLAIEIAAGVALLAYLTWRALAKRPLEPAVRAAVRLVFRAGDLARLVHRHDNRRRVTAARFGDYKSAGPPFFASEQPVGYAGSHRRRRPGRADARHRPRPARRALHPDRAERRAAIPAQDGALQRAHHGNLPPAGLAQKIRDAGFPRDVPMDVFIVTSLVEPPLLHLPYPSVAQAQAEIAACNDGTLPLEPYQLISQYTLEPLLKSVAESHAERRRCATAASSCRSTQDAGRRARHGQDAAARPRTLSAHYLVGCDGGIERRAPAARHQAARRSQPAATAPGALSLRRSVRAHPDRQGPALPRRRRAATFLIVQDSTKHFTLHSVVESDADMAAMFEKTVAMPVEYEMLYVGQWRQNLLLADSYSEGRVFLAGDAVHLVIPTGGLGMNSGVGDAIDLSWKLAATLQGWGGPHLLASYEIERRQIGARNVEASRQASRGRRAWRAAWRAEHPRRHAGRRRGARQSRAHRRCRAAQEQRDDRRRTRLPLSPIRR